MTAERWEERVVQARLDLAGVDEQVAAGELDEATAKRLRARYEEEIETAGVAEGASEREGPSLRRVIAGAVLMTAAIIGVVFLVANAIDDREPGEFVTGNIEGRDLSEISTAEMEEVVADFPNVVGMRLALARRYFDAGDFSEALPHYLAVLEQDAANPEANANVGWMTFLSDPAQSATAAAFLDRALESLPDYPQASFYLANVRLYGLNDAAGARTLLEALAARSDLPDDVASAIDAMLLDAGGSG